MEDHADNFNCTGGAAAYIDRKIFGVNHIYGSPTCKVSVLCNAIFYLRRVWKHQHGQHNGQKKKRQKDKQWPTKHYTEN
jgi:hypothetical protein